MKHRFIFFILTIAGILTADLSITLINKYIMTLKTRFDIHIVTLIGMAVVLILFYILIKNINRLSDWFVGVFVSVGRAYLGRSIGLFLSITILFTAIFAGYYWAWFDKFFHREIIDWINAMIAKL